MTEQFEVKYVDRGRPPTQPPNPDYPEGIDLDPGQRPACKVELPYMTHTNVGYWHITCKRCGVTYLITMASRPDDPRSLMFPCKTDEQGNVVIVPEWTP